MHILALVLGISGALLISGVVVGARAIRPGQVLAAVSLISGGAGVLAGGTACYLMLGN